MPKPSAPNIDFKQALLESYAVNERINQYLLESLDHAAWNADPPVGKGRTIAAVNWTEPELRDLGAMEQARRAGELLAERGKAAGIESAVFDRGGYQYHGRVQALADGARGGGLSF